MIKDVNYFISSRTVPLNTTYLNLPSHINCLDGIDRFKKVELLILNGICYFEHVHKLKNLKHLYVLKITINSIESLNEIDLPTQLKYLSINSSSLKNIKGIEKFKKLKTFALFSTAIKINEKLISKLNKTNIQRILFPSRPFNIELLKKLKIPNINIHPDMVEAILKTDHMLEMKYTKHINDISNILQLKKQIKYLKNLKTLINN